MRIVHGAYSWGLFVGLVHEDINIFMCTVLLCLLCVWLGVYVCLYVYCYGPIKGFVILCCYSYDFGVFICCVITVMTLCWGTYNHWGKGEESWA